MAGRITEVKRHVDGREQRFECEQVVVRPGVMAVMRFQLELPLGPYPPGTHTLGFFWRRRNYNLYRMDDDDGQLMDHRFDVIEDVTITEDRVEYLDLLLDVRISPTNDITIEDEDEARDAARKGLIDERQVNLIERTLQTILRDHRRIVRDALGSAP